MASLQTSGPRSRGTNSSPPPSPAAPGLVRRRPRGATRGGSRGGGAAVGGLGFRPPVAPEGATRGAEKGDHWRLSYTNKHCHDDPTTLVSGMLGRHQEMMGRSSRPNNRHFTDHTLTRQSLIPSHTLTRQSLISSHTLLSVSLASAAMKLGTTKCDKNFVKVTLYI
jgi:hypothetical protein